MIAWTLLLGFVFILATCGGVKAWMPTLATTNTATLRPSWTLFVHKQGDAVSTTRQDFLNAVMFTTFGTAVAMPWAARADEGEVTSLPNGVKYRVVKSGDGAKPEIGELAAIRFAAYCNDFKIDDIFDTAEPYYTRVGGGGLIKGVEQTLPLMRTGDRWVLTVPGELAFGKEGRRASAGKPRIPSDATIVFDVEIIAVPGREQELIDVIGDD